MLPSSSGKSLGRTVFLPTNAYSSFFYILTGLHALHIVAGLIGLLVGFSRPRVRGLCIGFWHFLGLVWVYVLAVLKLL